ncbi:MAG: branched-chain amino acid ABC transporter permease [Erysipelotrichia bacterium]|jgi:branched-chain amino acid transport system permease protein|nr:branched-chain amino acid ABC transporter permease [Erysipelotrichia bacterium]
MSFLKKHYKLLILVLVWFLVLVIVNALIDARIINAYYRSILYGIGINMILGVSLNLIIGLSGQLSLGHGGFMSIGAYSAAIVLRSNPNLIGLGLGILIGMLISLFVSYLVAVPTLRLKGDYLAIATLGVGEIIRIVILNLTITNGASGISNIRNLMSFPLMFVIVTIAIVLTLHFKYSKFGRAALSVKADELASEAMGVNVTQVKVLAFMCGALLAAVAGSLYATTYYVVKPETFGIDMSISILIIVVLGGMGSLSGSLLAAIFVGVVNMFLQSFGQVRMLVYAIILILVMIFRPEGLLGLDELSLKTLRNRFFKKKEVSA